MKTRILAPNKMPSNKLDMYQIPDTLDVENGLATWNIENINVIANLETGKVKFEVLEWVDYLESDDGEWTARQVTEAQAIAECEVEFPATLCLGRIS